MTWKTAAQVEPLNMPTGLKFVLVKYANHADNDGFDTWPSYQRVAHFTGQATKTVQRAVERLRDEKILIDQGAPYGGAGKRGRGIAYRIDFERAKGVYGYWVETRTNKGFRFDLVPPSVDLREEAAMAEREAEEEDEKTVDMESTVYSDKTVDSEGKTVDIEDENCGHDSPAKPQKTAVSRDEPSKNLPESARAREAGGGDPQGPPPACAVWRDNRARLEALDTWPLLERAIPVEDTGEVLTVAVEAPILGFAILAWVARAAEGVLDRRLACQVKRWVRPALIQRGIQGGGALDASAHRREGELVTLEDPAWRLWQSKAQELVDQGCQVAVAQCLPDDIDAGLLVVVAGSSGVANMLHEDLGKNCSRILGIRIRARFLWCLDVVMQARSSARARSAMVV